MKLRIPRISQLLFLAIFLVLFVATEYRGKDEISAAINSFFRANPLVAVSYLLSVKGFTLLLLPGLLVLLLAIPLGRFFCGWICPLGTIIDLVTGRISKVAPLKILKTRLKYFLLITLLGASLFGVNMSGIFDPIAILVRALTFFFYPLLGDAVRSGWSGLYGLVGEHRDYLGFFYDFLRTYLLPFRETFYPLAFLSSAMFVAILFLERYEERNWCKNLCPLGTLLGAVSRFSLFRRVPQRLCKDCGDCKNLCPTAFDQEVLQKENCILCMNCSLKCRYQRVRFSFGTPRREQKEPLMGRRVFVGGMVSGFFLSRLFSFTLPASASDRLLRPPGVRNEDEFLKKCVRCGECIKVCLKSALYPAVLQSGVYGVFTPVFIPRLGYCEYNCNLCGQVCPTEAIPRQPLEMKKKSVIGAAVVDENHCLPYAKKINCIVCEEHCPVPEKAIRFQVVRETNPEGRHVVLKKPYVVEELCNGCGICENKCPIEGKGAIEVFSKKGNRKV